MEMTRVMIETNRLQIKPLTADELSMHIESPEDFAQGLGLVPSQSLMDKETKEAILNDLLPNIDNPAKDYLFYTMWILIEKQEKAIIGGLCFHGEPNEVGEIEIGYGTDSSCRNKGFMTEAIGGLIQWIYKNKPVKSIIAETEKQNIASIKVLEKNGFKIIRQTDNTLIFKHY